MPEDMIEIGGFTRQCVDIVAGDPGSGKTYSRNILAVKAKLFAAREQDKKLTVHFISGEMRASEWAKEINSCELLKKIISSFISVILPQQSWTSQSAVIIAQHFGWNMSCVFKGKHERQSINEKNKTIFLCTPITTMKYINV